MDIYFFKLGALTYISWILALVIKIQMNFTGFLFSYYPLRILTTLLIYWIGYQGFTQLRLLKERKLLRAQISIDKQFVQEQPETREDINTIDEKIAHQFAKIDDYIKTEKKYLQTKYTLDNLCDDLGFSSSTLSHIINSGAKRSFSDYMNELRVEQAKKLLLSDKYKEYTIAAIGLESGFNSKSSFYHVFKKHTDHTPAQYKTAFSSKLSQN